MAREGIGLYIRHTSNRCALCLKQEKPPCHAGSCPWGDNAEAWPRDPGQTARTETSRPRAPHCLPASAPRMRRAREARVRVTATEQHHRTTADASGRGLALGTHPARRGALCVPDTQPDPALLRCHRSCGLSLMEGKTLPQQKGPSSPYGDARLTAAASGPIPSNGPHGHTCRGLWAAQASKPGPQIRRHRPTDPTAEHEATYCPSLRAK